MGTKYLRFNIGDGTTENGVSNANTDPNLICSRQRVRTDAGGIRLGGGAAVEEGVGKKKARPLLFPPVHRRLRPGGEAARRGISGPLVLSGAPRP